MGATGTSAANLLAADADLVIAIGTRLGDFTTASKTSFQNPAVRFININVAEFDAFKHAALPLTADALVTLEELGSELSSWHIPQGYQREAARLRTAWDEEVERIFARRHGPPLSQGEVIGLLNATLGPTDIIVNAAGSLPGDLHKLWRTRDPKGYHMDYGYSCMGYEVAGGLGVKMADPSREVYVLIGDGSYLMMAQEIVTSLQENIKLNIVLFDNHGFSSIGGLSRACGSGGFGTEYRYREEGLTGPVIATDFAVNAASLGAYTVNARTYDQLAGALAEARKQPRTSVVVVETDYHDRVGGYHSWWDVPIAEVSESQAVQEARAAYVEAVKKERYFWPAPQTQPEEQPAVASPVSSLKT
jgi:3D-(3,5/4)-trihydroxycyclohexane-1,2-dione acylhydrolase (decyclizing)